MRWWSQTLLPSGSSMQARWHMGLSWIGKTTVTPLALQFLHGGGEVLHGEGGGPSPRAGLDADTEAPRVVEDQGRVAGVELRPPHLLSR